MKAPLPLFEPFCLVFINGDVQGAVKNNKDGSCQTIGIAHINQLSTSDG